MPDQTPSMPPLPEPRLWVAADLIEDPLNQHDNSILAYQRQQDVHPLDLPAAPLYTAEQVQAVADERVRAALERGFEAGWRTVARDWAMRDDLIADIGSPAYTADRDRALAAGSAP